MIYPDDESEPQDTSEEDANNEYYKNWPKKVVPADFSKAKHVNKHFFNSGAIQLNEESVIDDFHN